MRSEIVGAALQDALAWRAAAGRLVLYSDRGGQYASRAYRAELTTIGIECSMSRAGDYYDNARIESLFGTVRQEWVPHPAWPGLEDARASLYDYIEVFYNRERLHLSLGYRTPIEADHAATDEAAA